MPNQPCYIVLGATGGIGSEVCRQLTSAGAGVLGGGRNQEKLAELAQKYRVKTFLIDATDNDQIWGCFQEARKQFGRIDGIVNCVGSLLLKPAHQTTYLDWHTTLAVNLSTAFATVHAGVRALMDQGGSIVLLSSVAARVGLPNHEAVAAAKAGVIGLTLAAAATYAERGIRVNCVAPGLVRTPLAADLIANERALQISTAMHPLGRIGEPRDVASAICWLLNPEQNWVTGQVLGIDGGLSSLRSRAKV